MDAQAETAPWWTGGPINLGSVLNAATSAIGLQIAVARGWESDTATMDDGEIVAVPSNADVIRALREPFAAAAVLARLYYSCMVPVTGLLLAAVEDCEPLPAPDGFV